LIIEAYEILAFLEKHDDLPDGMLAINQ